MIVSNQFSLLYLYIDIVVVVVVVVVVVAVVVMKKVICITCNEQGNDDCIDKKCMSCCNNTQCTQHYCNKCKIQLTKEKKKKHKTSKRYCQSCSEGRCIQCRQRKFDKYSKCNNCPFCCMEELCETHLNRNNWCNHCKKSRKNVKCNQNNCDRCFVKMKHVQYIT